MRCGLPRAITASWWFVILLLVNTIAILDIIYIFAFGRPALKQREAESSTLAK
jgi:hypothetical protein